LNASLNFIPAKWISLRPSYQHSNRYYEHYDEEYVAEETYPLTEGVNALGTSPLLRRFDQADRLRDVAKVKTSIYPIESVTLDSEMSYRLDRYDGSQYGLQREQNLSYALDLYYEPAEMLTLFGNYSREKNTSNMKSRYRESGTTARLPYDLEANDWFAQSEDITDSFGFGFNGSIIKNKLDIDASVGMVRFVGRMLAMNVNVPVTDGTKGGGSATSQATSVLAIDFPELRTEEHRFNTALKYHFIENLTLKLQYEYQRYTYEDFSFDTIKAWQPAWNTSVFLASVPEEYIAHVVGLSLIYKF